MFLLRRMERGTRQFVLHHAAQINTQLQTRELIVSGILHLIFSDGIEISESETTEEDPPCLYWDIIPHYSIHSPPKKMEDQ